MRRKMLPDKNRLIEEKEKAKQYQALLEEARKQNHMLEELSRSQQLILNTSESVIIGVDNNGMVNSINPSVRKIFGYFEGEVEGKELSFLIPELESIQYDEFEFTTDSGELELFESEERDETITPEEFNYLERFIFGKLEQGIKQELQTRKKDGTPLWIRLSINRVMVEQKWIYSINITDITERKKKEEEALQLERNQVKITQDMLEEVKKQNHTLEKLTHSQNMILNTAHEVIIGVDKDRVIRFINPAVRQIFGYLEGEVEERELSFLIPELETLQFDSYIEMTNSGEVEFLFDDDEEEDEPEEDEAAYEDYDYIERFVYGEMNDQPKEVIKTKRKDGSPIWIDLSINRITADHGFTYSVFINDISEKEHSKTLEQLVEQRTTAIKSLMDNSGQGFLSFGADYKVQNEYSRACELFFGKSINNLDGLELLFDDGKNAVQDVMDLLFKGVAKLHQVNELLPTEIIKGEFSLAVDYRWIDRTQGSNEAGVMVILTDITKQKELASQLKKDEEKKEMITRVAINRDDFSQFIQTVFKTLDDLESISSIEDSRAEISSLFRFYHSVKGCSASFRLNKVVELSHMIETKLDVYRKESKPLDEKMLTEIKSENKNLFKLFKEAVEDLGDLIHIGDVTGPQGEIFNVPGRKIESLERSKRQIDNDLIAFKSSLSEYQTKLHNRVESLQQLMTQHHNIIRNLKKQPVAPLLKKFASDARDLAINLGKKVNVQLIGTDTEVHMDSYKELFGVLIHLIRNSVDHGIEEPHVRKMLNKPEGGSLTISVIVDRNFLRFNITDDGAGIDHNQIQSIAISKGIITKEEVRTFSTQKILSLIFTPGFSTKEKVTDISGRGVGMDSVKSTVDELKGSIYIQTKVDVGTTFTITLPLVD